MYSTAAAGLMLIAGGAPAGAAPTISEIYDVAGDVQPGYLDIVRAWVEKVDDVTVTFCMELAEPVPAQAEWYVAYIWGLDIDQDPSTGQELHLGSERNVRLAYIPDPEQGGPTWGGWVDYIDEQTGTPPLPMTIEGERIAITLPITEARDLPYALDPDGRFNWSACCFENRANPRVYNPQLESNPRDRAPNAGSCFAALDAPLPPP